MLADWSAECAADDPLIVVPWNNSHDPSGSPAAFIDLRADPNAIDSIPEAEAHPPLMQALRSLNAARSPVYTSKCDAWQMSNDELAQLRLDLGIGIRFDSGEDSGEDNGEEHVEGDPGRDDDDALAYGFISYIDCVCRDRALFASLPRHEHLLRTLTRLAAPLDHPHAALDAVLRPAFVTIDTPRQGWAITLYLKALGASPRRAHAAWAAALRDAVTLLRRS